MQCSQMRWFFSTCADFRKKSATMLICVLILRYCWFYCCFLGKIQKNSVVRYNMIKICLLKNKLIPHKNNTDSCKSIRHYVTTDRNATTQNIKKIVFQKTYKASYTRARRMVHKPLANSLHTVHWEPKCVGFLREHKVNWMCRVIFPCTGCPLLASGSRKINWLHAAYVPHTNGTVRKWHACVYKAITLYTTVRRLHTEPFACGTYLAHS